MTGERFSTSAVIATIIAIAIAGCGGPAPDSATSTTPPVSVIRLLEELPSAEVVKGLEGGDGIEHPEAARVSRLLRPRDRRYFARVGIEHAGGGPDERLALLLGAGTTLRFRLDLTDPGRLQLGLGWVVEDGVDVEAQPPVARVRANAGEVSETLLEQTLVGSAWSEAAVDVAFAGVVDLELSAEGAPGTWIAFSAPEIVTRPKGASGSRQDGWDLVLISLDTLRADHLGCYGYERPTSPVLDAFAERSFRFATAVSSAPWTLPSHQSLFNGLYPLSSRDLKSRPLATVLWQAGYRTEARAGGGVMDFRMGTLARGFDGYRTHDWIRDLDRLEEDLATTGDRRRFLFLHTYEPHDPYIDTRFADELPAGRLDGYFDTGMYPPMRETMTAEEKAYVEALYDGDIAYTDEQLGKLFASLEASGALERAIVVVTSDHGEQFWEHGSWRHGQNLYDEQLLVPLILSVPEGLRRELSLGGGEGAVIEQQVRLVDLYPTLLELLGLPLDEVVQGRSLVPLLRGEKLEDTEAFAEYPNISYAKAKAVRFRGFKLMRTRSSRPGDPPETEELYDLRRDPAERANVIDSRSEIARLLLERLERLVEGNWRDGGNALEDETLDEDLRRELEALGYIGGG